jgi:glycosyltransferase involved in cell wall biosynthesis
LALQSQCQRLGLDGRVVFHGQCGDVPARLAAADVFALVSDSEGMSLSLIEALASGLPVIATRVGNNAEFVNDGRNGYLIEPGDCDALQRALEQLFTDPAMRLRFGANSGQLANEQLDEERAFRAYIAAYLDAV